MSQLVLDRTSDLDGCNADDKMERCSVTSGLETNPIEVEFLVSRGEKK